MANKHFCDGNCSVAQLFHCVGHSRGEQCIDLPVGPQHVENSAVVLHFPRNAASISAVSPIQVTLAQLNTLQVPE